MTEKTLDEKVLLGGKINHINGAESKLLVNCHAAAPHPVWTRKLPLANKFQRHESWTRPYTTISRPDVYNYKRTDFKSKILSKTATTETLCVHFHWDVPSPQLFQLEPQLILWRCTSFRLSFSLVIRKLWVFRTGLDRGAIAFTHQPNCTMVCLKANQDHLPSVVWISLNQSLLASIRTPIKKAMDFLALVWPKLHRCKNTLKK